MGKTEHVPVSGGHLNLSSDVGHQLDLRRGSGNVSSSLVMDDGLITEERLCDSCCSAVPPSFRSDYVFGSQRKTKPEKKNKLIVCPLTVFVKKCGFCFCFSLFHSESAAQKLLKEMNSQLQSKFCVHVLNQNNKNIAETPC